MSHQREQHTVSTSRSSGSTDKQGGEEEEGTRAMGQNDCTPAWQGDALGDLPSSHFP